MDSQTKAFSKVLTEVYEKTHTEQDITLAEIMDELKVKLNDLVQKESDKWMVMDHVSGQ